MSKRRGRPPFKPTRALRTTVERMLACSDSHDTIARALGVDSNTLRKHFPDELLNGAAKRRRQVVDMVFSGAGKGNASLIKRAEEMTRESTASKDILGDDAPAPQPRAPALGKKEIRRGEALVAGESSEWGEDLKPLVGTLPN